MHLRWTRPATRDRPAPPRWARRTRRTRATLRAEELEHRSDERRHADHLAPASPRTRMKVAALRSVQALGRQGLPQPYASRMSRGRKSFTDESHGVSRARRPRLTREEKRRRRLLLFQGSVPSDRSGCRCYFPKRAMRYAISGPSSPSYASCAIARENGSRYLAIRRGPASTGSKPTSRIRLAATSFASWSSPQYTRLGRRRVCRFALNTSNQTSLGTSSRNRSDYCVSGLPAPPVR